MAESYKNYGAKSDVNCLRIEFRLHDLLHEESLTFMSSSFPNIDVIETELNHDTKHLTSIIRNEIDPAISNIVTYFRRQLIPIVMKKRGKEKIFGVV